MSKTLAYNPNWSLAFRAKLQDYVQLTKFRLSALVVFSAVAAFMLVSTGPVLFKDILMLGIAGLLLTGGSNALNQIIERSEDKLMDRTKDRPLATGRMSVTEGLMAAGVFGMIGIAVLGFYFNTLSGLLGALSLIAYAFVYTPLKKIDAIAVFVGAIPGAMPLLIGSTAAVGSLTPMAMILFMIQFFWQMPHFWAIAWVARDDYAKAGYYLLPGGGEKNRMVAMQSIPYLILLLIAGVVPYIMGLTGLVSMIIISAVGLYFLWSGIKLVMDLSDKSARRVMFTSFAYIPVALLAMIFDKL